ncbi:MAG: kinase/pyrophosphorylase [Zhongshania sp.]|uniref:posphoenolpyruvate synthetase regulatory kinase/phosphorylase PpsR n=1 Tax=Zhongshania sp. TaxID=1971902 RepID=UPI00261B24E8|nr:pyruvate, water dikinase regulatory protein [Zhongshania sp.]MDF1691727.1 kinase/pyrophosphorylase [Zhongshania sp.]
MIRAAIFISDSTGITAETLGSSILSQFENQKFNHIVIPYVDTVEKARSAVEKINRAAAETGNQPIVFDTLVNEELCAIIATSQGFIIDVLGTFVKQLEIALDEKPSRTVGRAQSADRDAEYKLRIDAVNYALDNDDGARLNRYDQAEVILIGVSRSGKTPTCLYLAMQSGVFVANYPITEEDMEGDRLPKPLLEHRSRLFGLTIEAERLSAIRSERRPNSRYASLRQCEDELRQTEAMFQRFGIPYLNITHASVEEIATRVLLDTGLRGHKR